MSKRRPPRVEVKCVCGNPAGQGALICWACTRATGRRLDDQQHHYEQLGITFSRQARLDPAPEAGRSANRPLPYHTAASDLLREQQRFLTRWCVTCVRDLHTPEPGSYTVRGLSMHIESNLRDLRKHDRAPDLVDGLRDLNQRILTCIDRQDRSYPIGPCPVELEQGGYCPGKVIGFIPLSDPDSKRPAKIACETCGTEWPGTQWSGLARLIQRRKVAV